MQILNAYKQMSQVKFMLGWVQLASVRFVMRMRRGP
jgi:hypothetical protein